VSVRRFGRGLDWSNQPHPYKEYPRLESEPLPAELDRLLRLGAGVVRGRRGYEFRTYSSAGALYPVEVYVATPRGLFSLEPTARVYSGFVDEAVNRVVGADGEREAALALLAIGSGDEAGPAAELAELEHEAAPLSADERRYPEANELHAASALRDADDVRRYRSGSAGGDAATAPPIERLEHVLRRRVSTREFSSTPIPRHELAAVLDYALAAIPIDVEVGTRIDLIANAVEELEPGIYRYRAAESFVLVRAEQLRPRAGYLVLEQELGERAAAVLFVLADLDRVLDTLGNRGYGAAQLEGGIRLGRLYLGATARGWGVTGTTFYDEDVSRELETEAAPMTAAAVGRRQGAD
jgi:nitroreductase